MTNWWDCMFRRESHIMVHFEKDSCWFFQGYHQITRYCIHFNTDFRPSHISTDERLAWGRSQINVLPYSIFRFLKYDFANVQYIFKQDYTYLLTQIESLFFIIWGPSSESLFIAFCYERYGLVAVGTKVCSIGPGHMTKMAAMPINGKKLLLRKPKADDLETWYAASGARVPSLFKWWPWVDHDLF